MLGPGKYDDECTELRAKVEGGIALIVLDGNKGGGFSVQANIIQLAKLPSILRIMADHIENDLHNEL